MRAIALLALAPILIGAAPVPSDQPDATRLKALVEKLVSFGTRHSLSSATDKKRGIGAARAWAAGELTRIGKACGGCLFVEQPAKRFDGPRAPDGVNIVNVMGIQRGTGAPDDVVIIAGHIDSRASDVMDAASDAPGANDDGSGSALVLEAARLLSQKPHRATIVYALLSGEEQGLMGGRLLVETAKTKGWRVLALLNNDIVGNSVDATGTEEAGRVRVFSEGIRLSEDEAGQRTRRANGGEDDGPSRALAKAVVQIARGNRSGLEPFMIRRPDRFGRGGDHLPALEAGLPAIRFTSGIENYDAQHQNPRTEGSRVFGDTVDRMDFVYLAKVTRLNIDVARSIAGAPPPPADVTLSGAVSSNTVIRWTTVAGASGYRVRWRRADSALWSGAFDIASPDANETVLNKVVVDDHFFGVSTLGPDGAESLVTFGGLGPR